MKSKISGIFWGLILVAIGVIFAGNVIGFWQIELFFSGWWTLFIMVPCLYSVVRHGIHAGPIIGFCVGVLLLLSCQNVIEWGMVIQLMIPILLVVWGLSLIFGRMFAFRNEAVAGLRHPGQPSYDAVFSNRTVRFNGEPFDGAEVSSVFGGCQIDLAYAVITSDCCITVSSVFGGTKLILPQNVRVKTACTPIFGGISNTRKDDGDQSMPIVYVSATCVFGGLDIR